MSRTLLTAIAMLFVAGFAYGACGGDDDEASPTADETDGAFIAQMVPHHESAIEMATMAQDEAEHADIRKLADDIVAAQEREIDDLETIHERIFGVPLSGAEHGDLGMNEHMMGMDADMQQLEMAGMFDQMFIDMMIPHHQGAIRMARVELAEGQDAELKEIAQTIIEAQSAEIDQMNRWREQWYGEPSPTGGVPSEDEEPVESGHGMMGH